MITVSLAQQLQLAGLVWTPASGDRFVLPQAVDDDVFVISELTIEVHELPTGRIIGFNGTTEWALDSVKLPEVVWLPREGQLREALGEQFVRLEPDPGGYAVTTAAGRYVDADAECAYAAALLAHLMSWTGGGGPGDR